MVEVDTRQIALLIAIALLLMALVGPASAQVQAVQVTQDTVDDAQDATQDTVDDAQGTAGQAVDRAKKTKADHKKVGALQGDPSEGDEDDLSELIDEGQSIGGTFQAEDEPEPRQTSPLDRVREMFDLPITGLELLLMVAIGVALAIVGVALWRLARRPAARTSRREIKHS